MYDANSDVHSTERAHTANYFERDKQYQNGEGRPCITPSEHKQTNFKVGNGSNYGSMELGRGIPSP